VADIFVSYATEDRERIKPLVEHLQSLGWSVWWDRELVAGPSFDEKIEAAIQGASCVVVAWSQTSIASRWVRAEANEGLERQILVPLLLEDVRPPLVFRSSHAANLIGWPERRPETEMNTLIAGIRHLVGATAQHQAPLCEGIAEEILNRLARIRDLKVIGRTSSFQFDPSNANIREIGHRLGVRHVLEGSVRTAGNQVRISARLVECGDELQHWSETYTRELIDLFALYDEVAESIGRSLNLVIGDGRSKSTAAPTKSEEALRLVMQARFKLDETRNPRALIPLVEQAIALDPDYADAQLMLGRLYFALGENGYELPEPFVRAAQACVQKALLLDPDLSEAHELLGSVRAYLELDWTLAAESWKQGDRLRGYPKRYNRLCMAGHYEAAEQGARHAIEHDPLNVAPRLWLGRALDRLDRVDEATVEFEKALTLQPRNLNLANDFVEHWLDFARDVDRAERFLDETQYSGGLLPWLRAYVARAQGDDALLRSLVEQVVAGRETRYVSAQGIEQTYYDLGEYAAHIQWFAVRVRERANLYFVPMRMRDHPDYWDRLSAWVLEDPAETRSRMALLNEHRARIERITERLVLPRDYIDERPPAPF
jgi:TolB-like protein